MELKCIEIENFLSYYNKNIINFSPLTTIFIGQNNTGKSKLFDSINFCLYNRIYDSQKEEWEYDDNEISDLILNKHKYNESLKSHEPSITVSVKLSINNLNKVFEIIRLFNYKFENNKYKFISKNINFTEIDTFDGHPETYINSEAIDRLKLFFPDTIKNFFLFQGEAANKIMQLQKGGNFRNSVREIARLDTFEEAKEMSEKYENYINNKLVRKINKNKKQKEEQLELEKELDSLETDYNIYKQKFDSAEQAVATYTEIIQKLETEASGLSEFEEFFKQKKILEENRKKIEIDLNNISNEKYTIAEDAVFYKIRDKINSFKEFYNKLEEKGEVPPSISISEIKKALSCNQCTICGTDLSSGTKARLFAESRLPKCDTDKLGDYLRSLNNTMADVCEEILKIPNSLNDLINKKRLLETRIGQLKKDKEVLQEKLDSIEIGDDSTDKKLNRLKEIRDKLNRYYSFLEKANNDKNINLGSIEAIDKKRQQVKKLIGSLITGDIDISTQDKLYCYLSSKINSAMKNLFEVANKTAYEGVQERANQYYKEMTENNTALVGDIKIDIATSEIYTVDEQGNRIRNINQGNKISIQLAVIAGILTIAQEQFGIQYPFVTDAPVSALGGDNKLSTIKTMINAFEQSIIIIKDDTSSKNKTNDELRKLIEESSDVGIAYELSLCKSESINDQYTIVTKIKG